MGLIQFGFTAQDVEYMEGKMDLRKFNEIKEQVNKKNSLRDLQFKKDMCEAFSFAFIAGTSKAGNRQYTNYLGRIDKQISKLRGEKIPTIWDLLPRKKIKWGKN